ncbi:hypothetical protein [Bartonella heixiaziensis]|uniref:hypothetical protein n=1 Tax=Bartonella heixiaziensis TaxID=1461000 RepID=UPI003D1D576D
MMDKKQIQTSQDHRAEQSALSEDQPLDPAVERVRKKLMRLMMISIVITLISILVVLFLIVYKITATGSEVAHHTLSLPEKTQILSQSLSEHNIVLKILTPDGHTKFMVYNYHTGALIAVLSVKTTEEIPTTNPR